MARITREQRATIERYVRLMREKVEECDQIAAATAEAIGCAPNDDDLFDLMWNSKGEVEEAVACALENMGFELEEG